MKNCHFVGVMGNYHEFRSALDCVEKFGERARPEKSAGAIAKHFDGAALEREV